MALTGNGERVSAETALRLGLVTEVVGARRALAACPRTGSHSSRRIRRRRRRAPCARSGSRSTSPTRRDGAGTHVHADRQPVGSGGSERTGVDRTPEDPMTGYAEAAARGHGARPVGTRAGVRWALEHVGRPGVGGRSRRRHAAGDGPAARERRSASCCATARRRSALFLGLLRAGACVVTVNPLLGARAAPQGSRRRSTFRCSSVSPTSTSRLTMPPRLVAVGRCAAPSARSATRRGLRRDRCRRPRAARDRRPHAHERDHRAAQAHRPRLRDARARDARGQALRACRRHRRPPPRKVSSSSTRRWST